MKKDHEISMAHSQLNKTVENIKKLRKSLGKKEKNIPAWVQAKITDTEHNMDAASGYMDEAKKCWKGYKKKGTQKLFGKTYNRCVKAGYEVEGEVLDEKRDGKSAKDPGYSLRDWFKGGGWVQAGGKYDGKAKSAAWTRKSGKNPEGGLNEKGRKSYERQNPGSDLKAPSKKVGNPRRASFCARMKGMKSKLTSNKTARDPDSRINKSLRAWNC